MKQLDMAKYSAYCNHQAFYGLASLIFLLAGMGIYFFFRKTDMILYAWIPKLEFFNELYVPIKQSVFTPVFLYNVPDALWFLSGIFFLRFIWFYKPKEQNVYLWCFYVIGVVFEISQLANVVPGTFDFFDLFFLVIGAFVEGLLYNIFVRRRFQ